MVLVVSFVALAILWPEPKLEDEGWRPLPRLLGRVVTSRVVEILCGAIGIFLLGVVVYAGFEGVQSSTANFAPTFIYVVFWLGFVPASVLLGDVFRAFNPWRAIGRGSPGSRRRRRAATCPLRSRTRRSWAAGPRRPASSRSPRSS